MKSALLPDPGRAVKKTDKKGNKETVRPREAANRFGMPITNALQKFVDDHFACYTRCKRASILWNWISGVSVERIEGV